MNSDNHDAASPDKNESPATLRPAVAPEPVAGAMDEHSAVRSDVRATKPDTTPPGETPPHPAADTSRGMGIVSNYELLEVIGRGGMGVVYKARHVTLGRFVALKMIKGTFHSAEALERFRREARAAAALNHPCIVPVYDIGEFDGEPFFTMSLVTGGNLQKAIDDHGPFDPDIAARLLRRVAEAVECAHSSDSRIIHRDIKPQNILLQLGTIPAAGERASQNVTRGADTVDITLATPMLTDFGIARAAAADSGGATLTRDGQCIGTPSYMPPEQARGDRNAIGPRSDVYSLGAVLYCMLTRTPLFSSEDRGDALRRVCEEEPLSPRKENPRVPRDLETICLKCLAKDPAQRYETAGRLVEDLDCFLTDQPLRHARRIKPLRRFANKFLRSVRRHPVRTAYIALSLAAFVALGAGIVENVRQMIKNTRATAFERSVNDLKTAEDNFERSKNDAETAEDNAVEAEKQSRRQLALEHYSVARDVYRNLITDYPKNRDEARERLTKVHIQRGVLFVLKREYTEAEDEFASARAILDPLVQAEPGRPAWQLLRAEIAHNLGILFDARATNENLKKARTHYQVSLDHRKQLYDSNNENGEFQRDLARSFGYIGDTELRLGLMKEAEISYSQALRHRQELVDKAPNDIAAKCQLARSLGNTGQFHDWMGNCRESINAFQIQNKYYESIWDAVSDAEFHTDFAYCKLRLAAVSLDEPNVASDIPTLIHEARAFYSRLLEESREKGKPDMSFLSSVAHANVYLCKYHFLNGDTDKARPHSSEVLRLLPELRRAERVEPDDLYLGALAESLRIRLEGRGQLTDYDRERVFELLDDTVKHGFTNLARLQRDRGFEPFQNSNRFKNIVATIEKKRAENRTSIP